MKKNLEDLKLIVQNGVSDNESINNWAVNYYDQFLERFIEDIELVEKYSPKNGHILDIGSAPFYTTYLLREKGFQIQAIDINPENYKPFINQTGLEVHKTNIETEKLPFEDSTFDVILFSEVFEHLRIDLINTMSEFKRVLKPGGILLLSTPNFFEIEKLFNLIFKGRTAPIYEEYKLLQEHGFMGHVREYTAKDVKIFMEKLGYQCLKTHYRGKAPFNKGIKRYMRAFVHRIFPRFRKWFLLVLKNEK
ncbi:MAG: class I SAM-dependent methyltransferase [Chitinophagaceae bacterium]|nr:MAG: class I SAM-dependent methyltransferase [Chitinophagaceae bacterium]